MWWRRFLNNRLRGKQPTLWEYLTFFKADIYVAGAMMLLAMAGVAFVLKKNFVFKG